MLIDLEVALVRAFGWSLKEIDETAVESLLPFIRRLTEAGPKTDDPASKNDAGLRKDRLVFVDEVNWL